MANLTALYASVRALALQDTTSISDATLLTFINEGLNQVAGAVDHWPWLAATTAAHTITGGTAEVALPSNWSHINGILIDGETTRLKEISETEAWERYGDDPDEGVPSTYFIRGDSIFVNPVPATDTDLQVYHSNAPTALTTGTDVPAFDARFHGCLVDWALYRLWQREEDYVRANEHRSQFNQTLNAMAQFYLNRGDDAPIVFGESPDYLQRRKGRPNMPFLDGV